MSMVIKYLHWPTMQARVIKSFSTTANFVTPLSECDTAHCSNKRQRTGLGNGEDMSEKIHIVITQQD